MFRFEKASPGDVPALADVQGRAFASDVERYGGGPPGYDSVEWQAEAIAQTPYYVIRDGDRIIGGIVARDRGAGHYYLQRLFVDPAFQKRGVASQGLAFIETALPARRWTLHTPYLNFGNQRFYEKRGYTKIGEEHPDDIGDVPDDFLLFHYEKLLSLGE